MLGSYRNQQNLEAEDDVHLILPSILKFHLLNFYRTAI